MKLIIVLATVCIVASSTANGTATKNTGTARYEHGTVHLPIIEGSRRFALTCLCNGGDPGNLEIVVYAGRNDTARPVVLSDSAAHSEKDSIIDLAEHSGNHGDLDRAREYVFHLLSTHGYNPSQDAYYTLSSSMQRINQGWPNCTGVTEPGDVVGERAKGITTYYPPVAGDLGAYTTTAVTEVNIPFPHGACGAAEWFE